MEKLIKSCEDVEILIQDYLDGYLLAHQRRELENHMSRCETCQAELIRMKKLEERLEQVRSIEVPLGFQEAIISRLPRAAVLYPWNRKIVHAVGMSIMTAIVILLITLVGNFSREMTVNGREVEIIFYAPSARTVHVVGDFSDWNLTTHAMSKSPEGIWRLNLTLSPGVYQYTFFLDEQHWAENPGTQALVNDGFGGRNALLYVEG